MRARLGHGSTGDAERGLGAPLLLLVSAVVTAVVLPAVVRCHRAVSMTAEDARHVRKRHLETAFLASAAPGAGRLTCVSPSGSGASPGRCFVRADGRPGSRPLVDLAGWFDGATPCPPAPVRADAAPPGPSRWGSRFLCTGPSEGGAYAGDLTTERVLLDPSAPRLAVVGRVSVGSLSIEGGGVVLAGGDVRLNGVTAAGDGGAATLVVVSLEGTVTLGPAGPGVTVRVASPSLGWDALSAPHAPPVSEWRTLSLGSSP